MNIAEIPDGDMIKQYLALRAAKKAIEERHAAELKPYTDGMELISNLMLARLNDRKAQNTSTPEGTAYKSQTIKPKIADRQKFIAFCVDQWDQWGDMMMVSAQVDAVRRWLEHYENVERGGGDWDPGKDGYKIPGVEIDYLIRCNIKRS